MSSIKHDIIDDILDQYIESNNLTGSFFMSDELKNKRDLFEFIRHMDGVHFGYVWVCFTCGKRSPMMNSGSCKAWTDLHINIYGDKHWIETSPRMEFDWIRDLECKH